MLGDKWIGDGWWFLSSTGCWSFHVFSVCASLPQWQTEEPEQQLCFVSINTILNGMNIHKSQLFWGSLGTRVLTHPQLFNL